MELQDEMVTAQLHHGSKADRPNTKTINAHYKSGGHTKSASYRTFPDHISSFGYDEAVKIASLERSNVLATQSFIRNHNIDCDMNACETIDVIFDQEQWDGAKRTVEYMNTNIPGGVDRYAVIEADEARKRSLCPDAVGALTYKAGSLSSYKFTLGVLKLALLKGLNLQTNTPVTTIQQRISGWRATTQRGTITTLKVILATNGYTARLCRAMQGSIVPLRGQITAQRPGSHLPCPLTHTYTLAHEAGYEYMIPRPAGSKFEGDVVIGGGWSRLPDKGVSEFGLTDDSALNPEVGHHLRECTVEYFGRENWGEDDKDGRVRKEWTGIMGSSADGVPYVGLVPEEEDLWISAAFNGHGKPQPIIWQDSASQDGIDLYTTGMVMCMKSAEAMVDMMVDEKIPDWFPRSFLVTKDRLKIPFEGRRDVKPSSITLEQATASAEMTPKEGKRDLKLASKL